MRSIPRALVALMPAVQHGSRQQQLVLSLACCCFCALGVAEPKNAASQQQHASRAMLEFLTEFSELDDAEFDLLQAYVEQDEKQGNKSNEQTEMAPDNQPRTIQELRGEMHD